ncbi:hypothetical protein AB0J72_44035, partial [Dactylosporangium sp. NPDC049742]|uniref:hypothetical protein n=1 Tax=Dactylosporangium sp. NPDC049742 TaxID=3154737 RepID=UPI00343F6C38
MTSTDTDDGALRAALHDYVTGGEPPLGLTSAGAVTAGRRAARRRRTLQVLAAATYKKAHTTAHTATTMSTCLTRGRSLGRT